MSDITVVRNEEGKLVGLTTRDQRAWARFRDTLARLGQGEMLRLSTWFPRNPKLHRLHMAALSNVHDHQEQFEDFNVFRAWAYVGAGECHFAPTATGRMAAIPKSVRYERMDDEEFKSLHDKCMTFLRSHHATQFLWPHLSDQQQAEMIDALLGDA